MKYILEVKMPDYILGGSWQTIAMGEFDSPRKAIDEAVDNFDVPIGSLRVRTADEEPVRMECDVCGCRLMRVVDGLVTCDNCGHAEDLPL
jgi:hypothetical protein